MTKRVRGKSPIREQKRALERLNEEREMYISKIYTYHSILSNHRTSEDEKHRAKLKITCYRAYLADVEDQIEELLQLMGRTKDLYEEYRD